MEIKNKAYNDYINGMMYKDIAKKYGVSVNTVKSWHRRDQWTRTKGAPFHNKNAAGGLPGNHKAEKHGWFSRFLPPETLAIVQEQMKDKNPIDLLWDNICIKYVAILRAQKIMYIKGQDDLTKVLKREKESSGQTDSWEKEYELQFAWDKQAAFVISS